MLIHSSALRIYPANDILNGRFSRHLRLEQSLLCHLRRVKNLVLTGPLELRIVLWLVFLGTEIKTPETPLRNTCIKLNVTFCSSFLMACSNRPVTIYTMHIPLIKKFILVKTYFQFLVCSNVKVK